MIDLFFITGDVPDTIVEGYYNYFLVTLSYIVASLASFVALDMASNIADTSHTHTESSKNKKFWLWGGAFAMGAGIWSMHFIGMLAYNAGMEVHYNFWITLLSLVVAILLSFFALSMVQVTNLSVRRIILASPILGMGIVTMHYTGMAAMEMNAALRYIPGLFAISVLIAVTASAAALWLAFHATKNRPGKGIAFKVVAALVMGVAICGMHYSGMAASVFIPYADCRIDYNTFDKNMAMAFAIACITFLILSLAIIASIINQKFVQHLHNEIEKRTSELMEANTKLEKTEKLAIAGELRMKMILDHIIDGVIAIDEYGIIQSFNKAAEHVFGYKLEEVLYKNIKMLMPKNDAQKHDGYIASYLHTGIGKIIGVGGREVEGLRKNGEVFPADLGINEVVLNGERIFIGVIRDISAQKEYEKGLYAVKEAAEQANRMKSEFLANMSHELRTPLNSLLILSEELTENQEGNLTVRQVEAAKIIYGSGNDLLTLINDILDLAKIEAGKIDLRVEGIAIDKFSLSIKRKFQMVADKKGLDLVIAIAPDAPNMIYTDATRLEQVLRNFLANAFKFTHHGSITLQFSRPKPNTIFQSKTLDHQHSLAIAVIDTGIGISADKKNIIFEAFQQADGATNRQYGGTGLGLSISREISHLLGGEIHVDSSEGQGSTFTLHIPEVLAYQDNGYNVELTETSSIATNSRPQLSERVFDDREVITPGDHTILIIEDDEYFVQILHNEAKKKGLKSIVTQSGNEGIRLAKTHSPQGIILDLGLPDMNGLYVIEALKSNPATAQIPIYVASVEEGSIRAFEKGAIGYMTKPVTRNSLKKAFDTIEALMHGSLKTFLIVEDDDILRNNLHSFLVNKIENVLAVGSAEEALHIMKTQTIDGMLLDIKLPGMSGLELLDTVVTNTEIKQPPVIIYSAKDLTEEESNRLCYYTQHFIQKNGAPISNIMEKILLSVTDIPQKRQKITSSLPIHTQEPLTPANANQENTVLPTQKHHNLQGVTILVADDDMRNTFALSNILGKQGMDVILASDGKQTIEELKAHPEIAIVLMDIMMPGMDGYETIRCIREEQHFQDLPIIAVTAKAMQEDQEKCLQAGAVDYLSKPIDKQKLFSLLDQYLGNNVNKKAVGDDKV